MKQLRNKYQLFINGQWQDASDNTTLKTYNPANRELLAEIADATKEDVHQAVQAAREAFKTWKKTSVYERAALLNKIADRIEENAEWLARVETMENGKPIRETQNIDIPLAVEHFRYFAGVIIADEGQANLLQGKFLSIVLRDPIGVVGQIVPWNFPFLMAAWKLAPVLAAGDTTVFKPSSATSLSLLEFIYLIEDLLPKGVVNVITGSGAKSGEFLKEHPGLDKLAFTGSTEVGRDIGIAAAKRLIPATLELGVSLPTSSLMMLTSKKPLMVSNSVSSLTKVKSAVLVLESLFKKASMINSSTLWLKNLKMSKLAIL